MLTHKGRTSSSGHYVGWARTAGDQWACFDDEKVTPCKIEDIMKLTGGAADWHTAYVVLYGPKRMEVGACPEPAAEGGDAMDTATAAEGEGAPAPMES